MSWSISAAPRSSRRQTATASGSPPRTCRWSSDSTPARPSARRCACPPSSAAKSTKTPRAWRSSAATWRSSARRRSPSWPTAPPSRAPSSAPRSPAWKTKAASSSAATSESAADEEWCDRRLLARIHRYTLDRLRSEIEPVSAQDLMRFLLRWQHLAPGTQLEGKRGLLEAVTQLQGYDIPAVAWERHILPARVAAYKGLWLDELCIAGDVAWARLAGRRTDNGRAASALPSATPRLSGSGPRGDLPWLVRRNPRNSGSPRRRRPIQGRRRDLRPALRQRRALLRRHRRRHPPPAGRC